MVDDYISRRRDNLFNRGCSMSITLEKIPDHFLVHSDLNGTLTFGDSTKSINAIISEIAGHVIMQWDEESPEMSYKDWVQKVRFKGDKYDPNIKQKQEEAIEGLFDALKSKISDLETRSDESSTKKSCYENAVAIDQKYREVYEKLAQLYEDPITKKVQFKVFPSFIRLIKELKEIASCTISTRTFGSDSAAIADYFRGEGILFDHKADFLKEGVRIEGKPEVLHGEALFNTLIKTNILGQDQFKDWSNGGYKAIDGKKMYCVADGVFQGKTVLSIALDDNLNLDNHTSVDPNAKNIAFPKDIYNKSVSWDSSGIIGLKVNTVEAAIDDAYLVREVNKELMKRGYAKIG